LGGTRCVARRRKLEHRKRMMNSAMAISRLHAARRPQGPKKMGDGWGEEGLVGWGRFSVNGCLADALVSVRIYELRRKGFRVWCCGGVRIS